MTRPRALIATRIFIPEAAAAAFRLAALADALSQVAETEVLTTKVDAPAAVHHGVKVRRWPVLRDRSGYVRGYLPYLSFDAPLLVRLLATKRPDVVVVEPPPTTGAVVRLVCRLRRIPYVWYAADVWSDATRSTGAPPIVVRAVRALESWVLRGAAASLAVSEQVTERVRDLGGRSVVTVGNGVDTEVFGLDGEERGGRRTIVYAGTASEWQGAEVFVQAMPKVLDAVPDARLVYLGQGSGWTAIAAAAADLPDDAVMMMSTVAPEQSAAWLRGAAAAVASIVPGQGYDFAIPTKLFAALGTGTPVVYAGIGAAADLVRENDLGWAIDHDVNAVAAAMIEALQMPDQQHERRRRARWVVENRSLATAARHAADVVLGLVKQRS